ncbi:MAG: hypothetical protein AAB883_01505 [Patescibacteria group bacterium]
MKKIIIGLLVFVVLLIGAYAVKTYVYAPAPTGTNHNAGIYTSRPFGISFIYPKGYYLKERTDVGTPERPQLSVLLVEDTPENRDLVNGVSKDVREGPTAITVDAYPNPEALSARDWMSKDTNWTIRTSEVTDVTVGTTTGASYRWSGLYEGKSTVVTHGTHAYVFSVTWMTASDAILKDYDTLLTSVAFPS